MLHLMHSIRSMCENISIERRANRCECRTHFAGVHFEFICENGGLRHGNVADTLLSSQTPHSLCLEKFHPTLHLSLLRFSRVCTASASVSSVVNSGRSPANKHIEYSRSAPVHTLSPTNQKRHIRYQNFSSRENSNV